MSALERQALKQKLGGLPPMPPSAVRDLGGHKRAPMRKRDYTPVHWDKYFQKMHDVNVKDNTFRVYECGEEGPVLFFLHGGGFSALSWALLSNVLSTLVQCRCAAVDLRGHGDSVTTNDSDLSAETLSSDVGDVVKELYGDEWPSVILIGHSMGGAIAVHTAERNLIPSLAGLIVIDVVEGTALEALASMQGFLRGRPSVFRSLEHAIEWCVRSGQVRNVESARVSMVGQVKRCDTAETATHELDHSLGFEANAAPVSHTSHRVTETIMEEEDSETDSSQSNAKKTGLQISQTDSQKSQTDSIEKQTASHQEQNDTQSTSTGLPTTQTESQSTNTENASSQSKDTSFKVPEAPSPKYTWRIELGNTEPYWKGWFQGLSQKFLACDVPKMLLLAGVDRLDKDLTIGQMQGKFQMQVLPKSGHAVHEDVPEQVADALATYLVRYKMAVPTADFHRAFPGC